MQQPHYAASLESSGFLFVSGALSRLICPYTMYCFLLVSLAGPAMMHALQIHTYSPVPCCPELSIIKS
jgi:hypothetical protein